MVADPNVTNVGPDDVCLADREFVVTTSVRKPTVNLRFTRFPGFPRFTGLRNRGNREKNG